MHFAVGMIGGGAAAAGACLVVRRGWRWIPLCMTMGGVWGIVPDIPRLLREDFPSAPLAALLGGKPLERWLHGWGDLFFGHSSLDASEHEYALHGLIIILLLYNVAIAWLIWLSRRLATRRRGARVQA